MAYRIPRIRDIEPRYLGSLPEGLWFKKGVLVFECVRCGEITEWYAEVSDFDIDDPMNMCGRSPYCCP